MTESQAVYSLRATTDDCAEEGNHDRAMLLRDLRTDPTTAIEDRDEWHRRIGWLSCALDVIGVLPELPESEA